MNRSKEKLRDIERKKQRKGKLQHRDADLVANFAATFNLKPKR